MTASTTTDRAHAADPTEQRPLTWPAAELDPRWPDIDPGLAAWRYRRVLDAIRSANATRAPACSHACCAGHRRDCPAAEVLVAVPVPAGWQRQPEQRTVAAYGCVATLVSREALDGTVLALFPRSALRREITRRLRHVKVLPRRSNAPRARRAA